MSSPSDKVQRDVLPIPDRPYAGELPLGRDTASPVGDDDAESRVFTGTVDRVKIDLGEDAEDADHLIGPEERLRVAMARQ